MEGFDLSKFSYKVSGEEKPPKVYRKPRQKKHYKNFLASIDLEWITKAAHIPGRALHAALALRHVSALQKSLTVKMQRKIREQFGLTPDTYNKALPKLEEAGLVKVRRSKGQFHTVTIIEIENPS